MRFQLVENRAACENNKYAISISRRLQTARSLHETHAPRTAEISHLDESERIVGGRSFF